MLVYQRVYAFFLQETFQKNEFDVTLPGDAMEFITNCNQKLPSGNLT